MLLLVLEDDFRPIQFGDMLSEVLAVNSSTLDELQAFVNGESWQMLRLAYVPHRPHDLIEFSNGRCSSECECRPSTSSPNVCAITLQAEGSVTPDSCQLTSMAAYAVHKSLRSQLVGFAHASYSNLTEQIRPADQATDSNSSKAGYFSTPIDSYFPATIRRIHYLTPGIILQGDKPEQLYPQSLFGSGCNHASVQTPLGAIFQPLSVLTSPASSTRAAKLYANM